MDNPNSGNWYIDQPNAPSTWVDVDGGGGISVSFQSPCGGTSHPNGVTIWGECDFLNASLFPNPAQNSVTITLLPMETQQQMSESIRVVLKKETFIKQVEIYDTFGKLMKQKSFNQHQTQVQMDVSGLREGVYFVNVSDGLLRKTLRLVVED